MENEIIDVSEVTTPKEVMSFLDSFPDAVSLTFGKAEVSEEELDEIGFPKVKTATAVFSFSEKGVGFGEFVIKRGQDGRTYIDTECMGPEKIKRYLCALVDNAIFDTEKDPELHAMYDEAMGRSCARCPNEQADCH